MYASKTEKILSKIPCQNILRPTRFLVGQQEHWLIRKMETETIRHLNLQVAHHAHDYGVALSDWDIYSGEIYTEGLIHDVITNETTLPKKKITQDATANIQSWLRVQIR